MLRTFAWAAAACVVVMLACVAYFAVAGSRMAFLRGATLVLNAEPERYRLSDPAAVTSDPLDVVIAIPAPPMDVPWWSPVALVDPDALVDYTLRKGAGNCAAKSRGLGWWLQQRGIPYRFVYLLSDPDIRHGDGHTMVEASWMQDGRPVVGLLDPLAAGVPMADGVALDSSRLIADRGGASVTYWPDRPDLDALNLRPLKGASEDSTHGRSFVAFSSGTEVNAHLRFMKTLSALLPDSFLFRVAGMSASVFLGIYPRTYVPPAESTHLSALLRTDMWVARAAVWSARIGLVAGLVACVAWSCARLSAGRSESRAPAAVGS